MGRSEELYFGTTIRYMSRYLWELEDCLPEKAKELRNMFQGHRMEYFVAIRIRGSAIAVGKEPE